MGDNYNRRVAAARSEVLGRAPLLMRQQEAEWAEMRRQAALYAIPETKEEPARGGGTGLAATERVAAAAAAGTGLAATERPTAVVRRAATPNPEELIAQYAAAGATANLAAQTFIPATSDYNGIKTHLDETRTRIKNITEALKWASNTGKTVDETVYNKVLIQLEKDKLRAEQLSELLRTFEKARIPRRNVRGLVQLGRECLNKIGRPINVCIYFLCNSESCSSVAGRERGKLVQMAYSDPELSLRGVSMTRKFTSSFADNIYQYLEGQDYPEKFVCSSLLLRSQQTADILNNSPFMKSIQTKSKVFVLPYITETGMGSDNSILSDDERKKLKLQVPTALSYDLVDLVNTPSQKTPDINRILPWLGCNLGAFVGTGTTGPTELQLFIVTHSKWLSQFFKANFDINVEFNDLEGTEIKVEYTPTGTINQVYHNTTQYSHEKGKYGYVPPADTYTSCPESGCRKPVCAAAAPYVPGTATPVGQNYNTRRGYAMLSGGPPPLPPQVKLLCPSIQAPPTSYKELAPLIKKLKSYDNPALAGYIKTLEALKPGWFKTPNIAAAAQPLQELAATLACGPRMDTEYKASLSGPCTTIEGLLKKPSLVYSNIATQPAIMTNLDNVYPGPVANIRRLKPGWFSKPSSDKLKVPLTNLYNKMGCDLKNTSRKLLQGSLMNHTNANYVAAKLLLREAEMKARVAAATGSVGRLTTVARIDEEAAMEILGDYYGPSKSTSTVRKGPYQLVPNYRLFPREAFPTTTSKVATQFGGLWNSRLTRKAGGRSRAQTRRSQRSQRRTKSNTRLNKRSHKRR